MASPNFTVNSTKSTDGSGAVSELIGGLEPLTTYHVRLSATNKYGTTVSEDHQFEMLLSWRVEGSSVLEPKPGLTIEGWNGETHSTDGTLTIVSPSGQWKLVCSESGYNSVFGTLGSEYILRFETCTGYSSQGTKVEGCQPAKTPVEVNLNKFLVNSTPEIEMIGANCGLPASFGLPPYFKAPEISESANPAIVFTGAKPGSNPHFKATYSSHWILAGSYTFGIY